jgi:Ca2+-binding RTX toxin-like protein/glucose/arabinose dehydrogenase
LERGDSVRGQLTGEAAQILRVRPTSNRDRSRLIAIFIGMSLIVGSIVLGLAEGATAAVDPNLFVDELVDELPAQATAGEWMPDGRLLVLGRNGVVATSDPTNGATNQVLAMTNVSNAGERGALDLALHPDFANNNQFFVYHATNAEPSRLRIVRFTLDENDATATAASYLLVWENPGPAHTTQYHIGGSLEISNDSKLLLTIGDGLISTQADDLDNVFGKVIRLNLDGSIPGDNPFADGVGPNLDEIYAYGLRNPFRSWVDPLTGEHWVGDVGGNTAERAYEEIDVMAAGNFYGWPACEGPLGPPKSGPDCPNGTTGPWYYYDHDVNGGCCSNRSITMGEKYQDTKMPIEMQGAMIFGDWADNTFAWVATNPDGSAGAANNIPANADARPVWISVGPDGYIYYIRYSPWPPAKHELRRIRYTGTVDNPPTLGTITATPIAGPAPLVTTFGSDAFDADGDPLIFAWDFGDGSTSTDSNPSHSYATAGGYSASLVVTANGETATAPSITVQVGLPPEVTITSPIDGSSFHAGQQLSLNASGIDADGPLTSASYTWTVDLLHEAHAHGVFSGQPGDTLPFDIATTGHDYRGQTGYNITVTLTDSDGLTTTDSVAVYPEKVNLTVLNNVGEGTVQVDGTTQLVPYVLDTAVGFNHTISASSPLCVDNSERFFASWSDGGAQSHQIIVPTTDSTFAATYTSGPQCIPCGSTWEAEAGMDVIAGFEVATDPLASGGSYLHIPDDTLGSMLSPPIATTPTVEYCVDVAYDGTWFVDGIVATVDLAGLGNSFYVRMDGGAWHDWKYTDNLAWNAQEAGEVGVQRAEWQLTAGAHTFELAFSEDGSKIDTFTIKTDDLPPAPVPNVVIGEIRYAPSSGQTEYVEIFNADTISVDVSDWDLSSLATFAPGTVLSPGERIVLAGNVPDLKAEFPGALLASAGSFAPGQSLSDVGGLVRLRNGAGATVDEVFYLTGGLWPTSPATAGASIERISAASPGGDAGSWTASVYGTPGAANGTVLCAGFPITIDLNVTPGALATAGNDVILGTPGDDIISALEGHDAICSGEGNDVVNGGPGDDTLLVGSNDDFAFGLGGLDTIFGGDGDDQLLGFDDNDLIIAGSGADTVNGGVGADDLRGGDGHDRLFGQSGNDMLSGGEGDDFLIGLTGQDTIDGGPGNDTINGGTDGDTINAGPGDDLVFGLSGDDPLLSGGAGNDRIFGQLGTDTIDGGPGNDSIWGNEDDDIIVDPSGVNIINGGAGNDTITGGIDEDTIFGDGSLAQAGNDTIDGGAGSDQLLGFAGDDTIISADGVADIVNGGPNGVVGDSCTFDAGLDTIFNCNP